MRFRRCEDSDESEDVDHDTPDIFNDQVWDTDLESEGTCCLVMTSA